MKDSLRSQSQGERSSELDTRTPNSQEMRFHLPDREESGGRGTMRGRDTSEWVDISVARRETHAVPLPLSHFADRPNSQLPTSGQVLINTSGRRVDP